MREARAAAAILGTAALAASLACTGATSVSTAAPSAPESRACVGLTPPRPVNVRPLDLPATFAAARLFADVPAEVTIGTDGKPREAKIRTADFAPLAPFAEETLTRGRFDAGAFEGHPAAIRIPVRVTIGSARPKGDLHAAADVWIHVAADQSREAHWQLRDSVTRVTVLAHAGKLPAGAAIVAVAPNAQTKTLLTIPSSDASREVRQTVAAGNFFSPAGTYRVELRAKDATLAAARFTIAEDYKDAVINACEEVPIDRKTGPGN